MDHREDADRDDDVTDAEHVGQWPTPRDRPDVTQEQQRGWSSNPEFANLSAFEARPADRTAAVPAGITPALAAMAIRFNAPPTATIQIPGIRRFTQRNVNNIP